MSTDTRERAVRALADWLCKPRVYGATERSAEDILDQLAEAGLVVVGQQAGRSLDRDGLE